MLLLFSCKDNSNSNVAVLTDKENLENFYKDYDTFWNPTEKDLELIGSITEGAFRRETADFEDAVRFDYNKYFFQIVSYVEDGKKLAYVNALCDSENLYNWKNYFYNVNDGGDCFWQVIVDLKSNTYSDFSMNGP